MKNYIAQIKGILSKTGWSQSRLAHELGVTFATVNRWLMGHAQPHPGRIRQIERLHKETVGLIPPGKTEISSLIKKVMANKRRFKNMRGLLRVGELSDEFLLELTYNSDAIEGSTLTKKETEAIIFDKATIKDKNLIEHLEATNHSFLLKEIFAGRYSGKIDETLIKKLHMTLMQGIREDGGEYSRHQRGIRGVELALPHPKDIPGEMKVFCKKVNQYQGHPIEHIAKMHADFETIHPFGDGNGRVGRLLMIIQLIDKGFAPCVIAVADKAKYYEFLEYAQKRSDANFVYFLAESIMKGYEIIKKRLR